jgi:hypothetical protein
MYHTLPVDGHILLHLLEMDMSIRGKDVFFFVLLTFSGLCISLCAESIAHCTFTMFVPCFFFFFTGVTVVSGIIRGIQTK